MFQHAQITLLLPCCAGSIPTELGNLAELDSLDLSLNQLTCKGEVTHNFVRLVESSAGF